ncbi:Zinc-type alcohol dehydrogenase-like protein C16A3.02c [Cladobotryum mycophilum]|uniref:Zinc-type alcohol dehydrogenase-like protein C16A3.02c n=1 Tax=Cladobotryum mycophilum TaxID=491253 RepID=A0ABR0SI98_9HYPO
MANQMKAWQIVSPGNVEQVMKLVDNVARPTEPLRAGHVLVQVASAGINPADYKVPDMGFAARAIIKFPKTLGMDFSGRVAAAGEGVSDVKVGDLVVARVDPLQGAEGALSEYVAVSRNEYALLPEGFDLDAAAGAPTTALTAYQSISPYVKAGDKIFINGGSGGAGTFGIQIAKALGCHVTVSCSTPKKSLCEELGADEVIDYRTTDVVEHLKKNGQVYKLAVDNVGNAPSNLYELSKDFLLPEGTFVLVGSSPTIKSTASVARSMLLPSFLGGGKNKFVMYLTKNNHDDLNQVAQWLGEGKIKTIIDSTFEFDEALKAFTHLKKGSSGGKIIVHVNQV